MTAKEAFLNRCSDAGLSVAITSQEQRPDRYNVELISRESLTVSKTREEYALLGIIAHCVNRKSIKPNYTYMYIDKSRYCLEFDEEGFKDLNN